MVQALAIPSLPSLPINVVPAPTTTYWFRLLVWLLCHQMEEIPQKPQRQSSGPSGVMTRCDVR